MSELLGAEKEEAEKPTVVGILNDLTDLVAAFREEQLLDQKRWELKFKEINKDIFRLWILVVSLWAYVLFWKIWGP